MKMHYLGTCSLCHRTVRRPIDGEAELVREAGRLIPHRHKREYVIRRPDDEREDSSSWVDYLHRMGGKRYGLL